MDKFYRRFSKADRENRYVLGVCRNWRKIYSFLSIFGVKIPKIKPMVFFGINPSTATAENDDPTILKIKIIAEKNNYGSWIMLNIYPKIESNPDNLPKEINKAVHRKNIKHIKKYINNDTAIVAAWGDAIDNKEHPYLKYCLKEIVNEIDGINKRWYSIGELTKKGNPRHPLYLKTDEKLINFNIGNYISN